MKSANCAVHAMLSSGTRGSAIHAKYPVGANTTILSSAQKSEKRSRPQAFARSLWDRHGLQDEFIAKIKMPYLKPHAWRRSRSHQRALASGAEATVLLGTAAASAAAAARARAGLCNGEARSRASMRAMDPSPLILRLDEASKNHWRRDRRPVI